MKNFPYPGVSIVEIPTSRTILHAETSVPAFVGVAERGAFNTPTLIESWAAYVREFGHLAWQAFNAWAVHAFFQEGGERCHVVRLQDSGGTPATLELAGATLMAASNGDWGNSLCVYLTDSGGGHSVAGDAAQPLRLNLQVLLPASRVHETGANATARLSRQLLGAYANHNQLAQVTLGDCLYYILESFTELADLGPESQQRINSQSMFVRVGVPASGRATSVGAPPSPLAGGHDGTLAFQAGLETLKEIQGIGLLATPDTVGMADSAGNSDIAQQRQRARQTLLQCEQQAITFHVVDPPYGLDIQNVLAFKVGTPHAEPLNSSYGALYYPWVWIRSPFDNGKVPMPPSGPVLACYVRSDAENGVWTSPAGIHNGAMRTVVDLETRVGDAEQNELNPNGINALRKFLDAYVVYGARTLSLESDWTYVLVRRLFIHIEQSLKISHQWTVFEKSDSMLWAAVSREINAFLTSLWREGALVGSNPSEAFNVICNASNNPAEAQAQGRLYVDIGLAPIYPTEFIALPIVLTTAAAVER
ncbi:phage tail sheath family protein [Xanthomonas medicagonis]|uniref:phage tail sheath family protein n=1 Tax=Xanthomonas medicagonis TaxID=3160841 RepID=UPI0035163922